MHCTAGFSGRGHRSKRLLRCSISFCVSTDSSSSLHKPSKIQSGIHIWHQCGVPRDTESMFRAVANVEQKLGLGIDGDPRDG